MTSPTPPPVEFGIVSMATSLGTPRDVAATARALGIPAEVVSRLGYEQYHQLDAGVTTPEFGARAARLALERSGLDPADIDYVVVANGATVPDYFNWDVSTAIAARVGLTDTPTLLLSQGCAAAVLAFQQVAGLYATRPDIRTVLLIAVDRVNDQHTRRIAATVDSDGAVGVVCRRGHRSLRWLATEQLTCSAYSDFFRLEYGAGAVPVAPEGKSNLDIDPAIQVYKHFRDEPDALIEWTCEVDRRIVDAVDAACRRAGIRRSDLARLVVLNDTQPSMQAIAELAELPIERTNAALAARLGHCGGPDPLICLALYHEQGEFDPGDLLALAGMSSGMHWFCTILQA